jgi:hypothetical protein
MSPCGSNSPAPRRTPTAQPPHDETHLRRLQSTICDHLIKRALASSAATTAETSAKRRPRVRIRRVEGMIDAQQALVP